MTRGSKAPGGGRKITPSAKLKAAADTTKPEKAKPPKASTRGQGKSKKQVEVIDSSDDDMSGPGGEDDEDIKIE